MSRTPYDIALERAAPGPVSSAHFGVNYVAGINDFLPDSAFAPAVEALGVGHLRYPGGTVTERYFDPNGPVWHDLFHARLPDTLAPDGKLIEGPGRLFDFAQSHGLSVKVVLPTATLLTEAGAVDESAVAAVGDLVADLLGGVYGPAPIDTFEIGNEYYAYPQMSAASYAKVADALIRSVDDAIATHAGRDDLPADWQAPKIAVQAGAGWRAGDNAVILAGLEGDTLALIDGVIAHYYPHDRDAVGTRDQHLSQIRDWEAATGRSDLDYFVSEWAVYNTNRAETPDLGMAQASTMLAAFDDLLSHGVDTATLWGAQFRHLDAGLTSSSGGKTLADSSTRLSVAGEMTASMAESLPGLTALPVATDDLARGGTDDVAAHLYGDADRAVLYLASRSDAPLDLTLDLRGYFGQITHLWGETLTARDDPATGWRDESDPTVPHGIADFDTLSAADLAGIIRLEPWEVLRVSIQRDGGGVTMADHDPMIASAGLDYADTLEGSEGNDLITAHLGDDRLSGRGGDDGLRGGTGADILTGGGGSDALYGDEGGDRLSGGSGADLLAGGDGDDRLAGDAGNDVLLGGAGTDRLTGGAGDDILRPDGGTASGGVGGDYFVISTDTDAVITDFSAAEGDRITLLGRYATRADLAARLDTDADGALIIRHEDGITTTLPGVEAKDLLARVSEFTPEGARAMALADDLNGMSPDRVTGYLDGLDSAEFDTVLGDIDPVLLFSHLGAGPMAALVNALDPEELTDLLGETGPAALWAGLGEMNAEEALDFALTLEEAPGLALGEMLGETAVRALAHGLDRPGQLSVEEALLGPVPPPVTQVVGADRGFLDEMPTVPVPEHAADPYAQDEDEDDDAIRADCFVATVVYAGGAHPDIWLLRWYRDRVMRRSLAGRALIRLYWWAGPHLARAVLGRPRAAHMVRGLVGGIVWLIGWAHDRQPGYQPDQPHLEDSRFVTIRPRRAAA